jgi:hypothetical protein
MDSLTQRPPLVAASRRWGPLAPVFNRAALKMHSPAVFPTHASNVSAFGNDGLRKLPPTYSLKQGESLAVRSMDVG